MGNPPRLCTSHTLPFLGPYLVPASGQKSPVLKEKPHPKLKPSGLGAGEGHTVLSHSRQGYNQ